MITTTCRIEGCGTNIWRPPASPIPSDICTRCWEEMRALFPEAEERSVSDTANGVDLRQPPLETETFGPLRGRAGGLKFDGDKPRMELLMQGMPRALEAVGQVLTFGAIKYEAHSWKLVEDNHNRYWAAKTRHELARAKGEQRDPETVLLHLAHEATNALFLLELALMEAEQ